MQQDVIIMEAKERMEKYLNENIKKNIIERYIRESEDAILLTLRNYGSSAHRELEKQLMSIQAKANLDKEKKPINS